MNVQDIDAAEVRDNTDAPRISDQFRRRWSPRALSGAAVSSAEIEQLVEAARWAPSCFNAQPWRFTYALNGTDAFNALFTTLVEGNQAWVKQAGALVAVISRTRYEHNDKAAPTHSFDAGAAWMSMALQAQQMGLVSHGMQGFDLAAAREVLKVPDVYDLPALIAVGRPGSIDSLPESYRDRETPSSRKPLAEILYTENFEGLEQ